MRRLTLILLLIAAGTRAESYTNRVGNVISGTAESLTKGRVAIRLENGTRKELPLTVFPESEQARLRLATGGEPALPGEVKRLRDRCLALAARVEQLRAAANHTPESAAMQIRILRAVYHAKIRAWEADATLTPETAAWLIKEKP